MTPIKLLKSLCGYTILANGCSVACKQRHEAKFLNEVEKLVKEMKP